MNLIQILTRSALQCLDEVREIAFTPAPPLNLVQYVVTDYKAERPPAASADANDIRFQVKSLNYPCKRCKHAFWASKSLSMLHLDKVREITFTPAPPSDRDHKPLISSWALIKIKSEQ